MTGMGGGSLMTPILILLFGFDAKVAVGTDILHGAIFKSFGAARHRMLGTVHARLALWMLVGSAPLSLVGVQVASSVGDSDMTDAAAARRRRADPRRRSGSSSRRSSRARATTRRSSSQRATRSLAVAIGAFGGFVVGLTSVGSGTFFGLAMLFALPADRPEDRRHRHVPRRGAALGRRHVAPPPRRRRHARDGLAARRLDPGRPDRLAACRCACPSAALRLAFGVVLVLSGIKVAGVPQATYVIGVALALGAPLLMVWTRRQVRMRRVAARSAA